MRIGFKGSGLKVQRFRVQGLRRKFEGSKLKAQRIKVKGKRPRVRAER
jgi:hypothetical protein